MDSSGESEFNYEDSSSLREIFKHEFDNYSPARICRCKLKAFLMTSKTDINPGRRFFACSSWKCRFFEWHDGVFPERCVELINKCRLKLISLQFAEHNIDELRNSVCSTRRMLKISIGINVVLMVVLVYMLGMI
ncbi:hypothetical protein ACFE04_013672 [Oxalis oulophora]